MPPAPPITETRSGVALDLLDPAGLAARFAAEDARAAAAVAAAGPAVARAIARAHAALAGGGRLVLLGAGTSGRLAALEAAECRPTFSSDRVVAALAGGPEALLAAREGAEDDRDDGAASVGALAVDARDLVLGVTASGRTPWVWGALAAADARGAGVGLVACAPPGPPPDLAPLARRLDPLVVLETGPEALTGSTRLKAGTATKCVLNAVTTGAMALLGKVMDDLMVDVAATNAKLCARARRIVADLACVDEARAADLLAASGGAVKPAVVMGRRGLDAAAAAALLDRHGGHLRRALEAPADPGAVGGGGGAP